MSTSTRKPARSDSSPVHRSRALIVAVVLASASGADARAQDVTATDRSIASGRDTVIEGDVYYQGATNTEVQQIIRQTLNEPDLLGLVEAAVRGVSVEANVKIGELGEALDLRREALARMFEILGREQVPPERLEATLAEIATRHRGLLKRVQLLDTTDPRALELRDEAAAAIKSAEYGRADELLAAAETIEIEAVQHLQNTLNQRALNAAAIRAERGEVARTRLDYLTAADHFRAAAEIVPVERQDEWAPYLYRQARSLYDQGAEFGDNDALRSSIAVYGEALTFSPRKEFPFEWAMTQYALGNALTSLGERDSGTARLEEAVAAFRAALEEWTREHVPLQWAATQNNLGNALRILGERESGTARLEEAVAAHRAALEEGTRERVPLDWAATQNNLGNALRILGERESGTARLEEAVAAYRAALEERTRERVPLDWATTQNNLGNALRSLGERDSGTARLEEAVAAYQAALEERTRERVPLDWATTQNNLGNALWSLGERLDDASMLQAAQTAVGNAFEIVVVEADSAQYEAYFRDRLQRLEQAIAAVKEARANR